MTLRTRLILTIGGVALMLVLPALWAANNLRVLRVIAADARHTHGAAYLAMGRFQAHMTDASRLAASYTSLVEPGLATRRDSALDGARKSLQRLGSVGYASVAESAGATLTRIERDMSVIDALLHAGQREAASDALVATRPLFAETERHTQRIAAAIDSVSETDLTRARNISATALTTTLLGLASAMFIVVLLGAWVTTTMIRPIHRLRKAMAAVAAGEFVVPRKLPYDRADEIGDLARSFRGMTEQLADLDRMKADFMSIATHELKTPINVVGGYAELIAGRRLRRGHEQQEIALTAIQEQSRILTQLVNQLLDISRLEAGGLRLEIGDMDGGRLLRAAAPDVRRAGAPAGTSTSRSSWSRRRRRRYWPTLDRLRDQVLGNLLANALKFTPEGGTISVRGWADDRKSTSRSATPAPACPPTSCRTSSTSTSRSASRRAARAPASASPSPTTSSRSTAAPSP
jgi:signal transduction histidine kinase